MASVKNNIRKKILKEISSGGVVYKKTDNKLLWLVCRSNPSKVFPGEIWRLPKGWIDDEKNGKHPGVYSRGEKRASEEALQETAKREVREEGGIEAEIIKKIGTERFFYHSKERGGKVLKFVTFYLMEYIRDTKDGFGFETAEIKWLEFDKAIFTLTHKGEKSVLEKARKVFESGFQKSLV